jgi:hypothetical protein
MTLTLTFISFYFDLIVFYFILFYLHDMLCYVMVRMICSYSCRYFLF